MHKQQTRAMTPTSSSSLSRQSKNWSPTSLISTARSHLNNLVTSWSLENVSTSDSSRPWTPRNGSYLFAMDQDDSGKGSQNKIDVLEADTGLCVFSIKETPKMSLKSSTRSLVTPSMASEHAFAPRTIPKIGLRPGSGALSAGDLLEQMERMPVMKKYPKLKKKNGSLDSIDYDEEEDDEEEDEFANELNFTDSLGTSSSCLSSIGSDTSFSNYRLSPLNFDDPRQAIAARLGYNSLESIELYYELHQVLSNDVSENARKRAVSKNVGRFGAGYEDDCHFPLVLPVFLSEELKRGSYVTWDYIHLMADAELARWERCALENLSNRFDTIPVLGRPIDHVNPDPNLFLRQLVQQLQLGGEKGFARVARQEKNRALKRWSSYEDLHRDEGKRSDIPYEHNFGGNQRGNYKSDLSSMTSDEALLMILPGAKANGSRPTCTNTSMTTNEAPYTLVNPKQLKGELLAYISRPGLFVYKITQFQLETFRVGLNMQLLSQLVLLKDIVALNKKNKNDAQTKISMVASNRRTLENLLAYDDCLVSVVRAHILRGTTPAQQAMAIRSVIEIAVLLYQIGNFYGLAKVVGALQGPKIFMLNNAWRHLSGSMPYHFRDYQFLARLSRQLNHSILSTNMLHIPTLPGLLNRIKLCCSASWDLFEAKRRFLEHPSLADWLHTEVFGNQKLKIGVGEEFQTPGRTLKLRFDPIRETFLSSVNRIRLMDWTYFPSNWAQRYIPAMPEKHMRSLLACFESFFGRELDLYRRYQLPKMSAAEYSRQIYL